VKKEGREVPIRITVLRPPAGVAMKAQRGRDELVAPTRKSKDSIAFDLTVRWDETAGPGPLRFLGEFAQGPPSARFLYVCSGVRAGQTGTPWDRRAKISLMSITPAQLRKVMAGKGLVLEARFEGTGGDGGPACASVPLTGGGWTVTRA